MRKYLYFLLFVAVIGIIVKPVNALSCQFSGNDPSIEQGNTTSLNITLTNLGPGDAIAIQVANPDNVDFFQFVGGSAGGWTANTSGGNVDFTGGVLNESQSLTISMQIQGVAMTSDPVGFTVYSSADGSTMDECSGGINVSVIEALPTPTPAPTAAQSNSSSSSSSPTATPVPATNTTTTVVKTVVISDTVAPVVQIDTKLEKTVAAAPIIEGKVIDSGAVNVGISKVQYSTDEGKSWLLIDEPNGASRATFSFVPEVFEDGNYSIRVRAIDKSGNIGNSSTLLLIIDRLPPRIIHSLWHVGPLIINGDSYGIRELVLGVSTELVVQGVGGVTEMELSVGPEKFELLKNRESGLWEGDISLNSAGEWDAVITAIDGGGSKIEQKISRIQTASTRASLPSKTSVTVWRFDGITGQFNQWNGRPYSQENPHEGIFNWFLPPGSYYIHLSAPGYNSTVSNIFQVDKSQAISINAQLKKWNLWGLFDGIDQFEVIVPSSNSISQQHALVGKQISWLEKKEWQGKDIILSIIPSWDPTAASRLTTLSRLASGQTDTPYVVIIPGANTSTVELLKSRGQYKLTMVADPDGDIVQDVPGAFFPLTLQVNRKGVVEEVLK